MQIKIHTINNSKIAEIISDTVFISTTEDGLNLVGNLYYQNFDAVIVQENHITPNFFDLKNGMAGELLQKFSNYRVRLAIVGNFAMYLSKAVKEFIYESNQRKQINFVNSTEEALNVLSNEYKN